MCASASPVRDAACRAALAALLAGGASCAAAQKDAAEGASRAAESVNLRDTVQARPGPDSRRAGDRRLRCWQEGRLIYESRGAISIDKSSAVTEFKGKGPKDPGVEVVDMKHGLCILENYHRR